MFDKLAIDLHVFHQDNLKLSELRKSVGVVGFGNELSHLVESVDAGWVGVWNILDYFLSDGFFYLRELLMSF